MYLANFCRRRRSEEREDPIEGLAQYSDSDPQSGPIASPSLIKVYLFEIQTSFKAIRPNHHKLEESVGCKKWPPLSAGAIIMNLLDFSPLRHGYFSIFEGCQ